MVNKKAKIALYVSYVIGLFVLISIMVFVIAAGESVTILYPVANANYTSIPYINYTTAGDGPFDRCWYSLDGGTTNSTDVAVGTNFSGASLNIAPSEGSNTVLVYCNITADSSVVTSLTPVTFRIDTTAPTITLPLYTNATLKNNTDTLTINVSVVDGGSGLIGSGCKINVNGTTNITVPVSNGWCNTSSISLSGLSNGNKTIYIYANDTLNNIRLNNSYVVQMIDRVIPNTTAFLSDTTGASNLSQNYIFVNISAIDNVNVSGVQIYLYNSSDVFNNTNLTASPYALNFTSLSDGVYYLNVTANDTSGNVNSSEARTIWLDSHNPSVNLISPANESTSTSTSRTFEYNVTDSNPVNCSLFINSALVTYNSSANYSGGTNSFTRTGLAVGGYNWSINCTDSFNNYNNSIRVFTVEELPEDSSTGSGGSPTYYPDSSNLESGYTANLYANWVIGFNLGTASHRLKLDSVSESSATITISSTPQQKTLAIGEGWKVELTGDNYYDLLVKLNNIVNNRANFTITSINEAISSPTSNELTGIGANNNQTATNNDNNTVGTEKKSMNSFVIWTIAIVAIVVLLIILLWYYNKK